MGLCKIQRSDYSIKVELEGALRDISDKVCQAKTCSMRKENQVNFWGSESRFRGGFYLYPQISRHAL